MEDFLLVVAEVVLVVTDVVEIRVQEVVDEVVIMVQLILMV